MLNPETVRDATRILSTIKDESFYRTMTPREFAKADLDALLQSGIFPEDDMRTMFLQKAENLLLVPVFHGDREMFEEFLETFVRDSAQSVNRFLYGEYLDVLGSENIDFFLYCIHMILGIATNPYLGLVDEDMYIKVFRYICNPLPEDTLTPSKPSDMLVSVSDRYHHSRLLRKDIRYRGIFKEDGITLNRNSLKSAVLEYKWLLLSDSYGILANVSLRSDAYDENFRQDCAKYFLKRYVTGRIGQYVGVSHASNDWFLENMYTPLEDLLSLQTKSPKIDRNEMRKRFVDILSAMTKDRGQTVPECALWWVTVIRDFEQFHEVTEEYFPRKSLLYMLYIASIVGEFATDINNSVGVDIAKVVQTREYSDVLDNFCR